MNTTEILEKIKKGKKAMEKKEKMKNMFCRKCGNGIDEKVVFCPHCGTKTKGNIAEGVTTAVSQPKKRVGLVLVLIYSAISSFMTLLLGLKIFFGAGYGVPKWVLCFSILMLAYAILTLASCYGAWCLKKWGYNLLVICYLISIPLVIFSVCAFISKEEASARVAQIVVNVGINIVILWYLFRSKTRTLFKEGSQNY